MRDPALLKYHDTTEIHAAVTRCRTCRTFNLSSIFLLNATVVFCPSACLYLFFMQLMTLVNNKKGGKQSSYSLRIMCLGDGLHTYPEKVGPSSQ